MFTVEEINLMCVFDTSNKAALINDLRAAMPDLDEDDMREIAETALAKLEGMTGETFVTLTLTPEYDEPDDGDEVRSP
jgi:hypothetical protein